MQRIRHTKYYLAALAALVTCLVYLTALQNGFVNWDDDLGIYNNPYIRSWDAAFFRWAFFDFYENNWFPLTRISHALDYTFWGLNPLGHHLTNIILHAVNTFVVMILIVKLLDTVKERTARNESLSFLNDRTTLVAAGVTALLFGLHPVHVESVAWVSERKDLLCALFYLLSIMTYVKFAGSQGSEVRSRQSAVDSRQSKGEGVDKAGWKNIFMNKHYLLSLGFFVLALLSKPMAVSLPLVLLILDWYPFDRIQSLKRLRAACAEKLPFVAFSLISSVIILLAQERAMASMESVPLPTRVLVATHALVAYLGKMVFPADLAPLYPYPKTASLMSAEYFLPLVLVAGITAGCIMSIRKNRMWLSAWGYYGATLLPVVGIVQVGMQSMADRYTYLPSLGPFLIAGLSAAWVAEMVKKIQRFTPLVKIACAGGALVLFFLMTSVTIKQIGIWKNGFILWNYTISKGFESAAAYNNRGLSFVEMGQQEKAIEDFDRAIALDSRFPFAYNNRGVALYKMGQLDGAMKDLNTAISLNQNNASAFRHRGFVYLKIGQTEAAVADLKKACVLGDGFACQSVRYLFK
jgi:protein O-mannosyl-transferase